MATNPAQLPTISLTVEVPRPRRRPRPGALTRALMIKAAPKTEEIPAVDSYAHKTKAGRS